MGGFTRRRLLLGTGAGLGALGALTVLRSPASSSLRFPVPNDTDVGSAPFTLKRDAISEFSGGVGTLTLRLKNSFRGSLMLPQGRYDEIRIIGDAGSRPAIYGSSLFTSGWTKTAGLVSVYERTVLRFGRDGFVPSQSGIVEVTASVNHPVGRAGSGQTIPVRPYIRQSPNRWAKNLAQALITLDHSPMSFMAELPSKKLYVHCRNSLNPNTLSLEYAECNFCLGFVGAGPTDIRPMRIIVENIDLKYSYGDCLKLEKARIDLFNVRASGSVIGNGIGADDCSGVIAGCSTIGNNNDGVNSSSANGATESRTPAVLEIIDHFSKGQIVGDGLSNHKGVTFNVKGGRFIANGKDGFVPAEADGSVDGALFQDNVSQGVHAYGTNAKPVIVDVRNCLIEGNGVGIAVTASNTVPISAGPTKIARVNSRSNHFRNNVTASLRASAPDGYAGFAMIESIDDRTSGAAPLEGHNAARSGTITTVASAPI